MNQFDPMLAKSECEECGEVRYTTPTFHGNICHECEEKLDPDESEG